MDDRETKSNSKNGMNEWMDSMNERMEEWSRASAWLAGRAIEVGYALTGRCDCH